MDHIHLFVFASTFFLGFLAIIWNSKSWLDRSIKMILSVLSIWGVALSIQIYNGY